MDTQRLLARIETAFFSEVNDEYRIDNLGKKPVSSRERGPLLTFFIPDLTLGGAEQVTVNIVNGLSDRGYNVELVLSKLKGELRGELSDDVTTVELAPSQTQPLGVPAHIPALAVYLRRREPAALFSHMTHVSIVCLAVDRVLDSDTLIIPTEHKSLGVSPESSAKSRFVHRTVPYLYPTADRIVAVSKGVADSIVKCTTVPQEKVSVLYNPVDIDTIRKRASEPVHHEWFEDDGLEVLLFVGRLEEEKDLETWLSAFEQVHERNRNVRGVIIGKGSRQESLQTMAEQSGIGDSVTMLGYAENPYKYMSRASAFVLSSRYEGLPTVLVEALACGCPVVATDCPGGTSEILADGEYGPLVPVGDASSLADGVLRTLEDPIRPERLRERAKDFAPESVLDDYAQFIEEHIVRTSEDRLRQRA